MTLFPAPNAANLPPDLLSLIGRDVSLARKANTHGGEYAGPCPFCGGRDRFLVWPYAERPGWWCRRCEQSGDAIGYLALRTRVSRATAAAQLGLSPISQLRREAPSTPPEPVQPPPPAWRAAANAFVNDCWKISIRRPSGEPKYYQLPGGSNALYGADALRPRKPALLSEGALDALVVRQVAGDLITAVASGATGARSIHWILKLVQTPLVLLAFDQDDGGDRPEAYWSDVLPRPFVWRPYVDDPAAMHVGGMSVRSWVEAGLAAGRQSRGW